jgi:hypothetical protein
MSKPGTHYPQKPRSAKRKAELRKARKLEKRERESSLKRTREMLAEMTDRAIHGDAVADSIWGKRGR